MHIQEYLLKMSPIWKKITAFAVQLQVIMIKIHLWVLRQNSESVANARTSHGEKECLFQKTSEFFSIYDLEEDSCSHNARLSAIKSCVFWLNRMTRERERQMKWQWKGRERKREGTKNVLAPSNDLPWGC